LPDEIITHSRICRWARRNDKINGPETAHTQYVQPFVKRQKNDAVDAEAIVIAARWPEMRFVAPKTAEQKAKAVLASVVCSSRANRVK
jgi:hypothetical protein